MSIWNSFGSGSWSTSTNWIGGVPDSAGATADFSNLANASLTHHIDLVVLGPYTIGTLALTSSAIEKYSLENGGLIMSKVGGAAINVTSSGTPLASLLDASLYLQLNAATLITTTGAKTVLDNQAFVTGVGLLTKAGSGTLKLSDATSNWAGGTHVAAGTVSFDASAFGTGEIAFTGNSALRGLANVVLSNDISVTPGVSPTIKTVDGTVLRLGGAFSALGGAGTVLHFGNVADTGTVLFAASSVASDNTGTMSIDGGTLKAGANFATLTSFMGGIAMAAGATLDANGNFLSLEHLTGAGTITNTAASPILANLHENGTATYSGVFADGLGTVGLNKIGVGSLTLAKASSYTGDTFVSDGTLRVGIDNVLGTGSLLTVYSGATFNLGAYNQTVAGLKGDGEIRADTVTTATLTTNVGATFSRNFSGALTDGSAVFGNLALAKTGAGTQILSGVNTYTGPTTVSGGVLALQGSGSISNSHEVTVAAAGTLDISGGSGFGSVLQNLTNAGQIIFGGKVLSLTHQSADVTGYFVGSAGTDVLAITLENADISLAAAVFPNWTGADDKIFVHGNALANTITGSSQIDALFGKAGNDTYIVGTGDYVGEGAAEGTADRVKASADYVLTPGAYVEQLTTVLGSAATAIDLTGNELAQEITGNNGVNILHDGGAGAADILRGLGGDDTYRVYNAADVIIETALQDTGDIVNAAVSYALGSGVRVETLRTNSGAGTTAIDLTGNAFAQKISGNAGDNVVDGKGGNDTISTLGGKDFIAFTTALGAGNVDTISDFSVANDTIRLDDAIFKALALGMITSDQFRANNTGEARDATDRIVYDKDSGGIFYDADGLGGAAGIQFATVGLNLAITHADFVVV